jgi:hypothetical protein
LVPWNFFGSYYPEPDRPDLEEVRTGEFSATGPPLTAYLNAAGRKLAKG